MTKSLTLIELVAVAVAIAVSSAATPATANNHSVDSVDLPYIAGHGSPSANNLPAPPKLAAPNAEPHRSRPPMVTMTWGGTPVFRRPGAPAGIQSLKSK